MCSKFSSFSLMGISNSEFFSDKDLNSMECNFLSRPALLQFQEGCQIETLKEKEEEEEVEIKKEDKYENLVSSLEIKLPSSLGEIKVKEEDEDGCRTPTSVEHTIPMMICPPAPRKHKSLPSRKRKATSSSSSSCQRRILLDLSSEIESLFPPALLADPGKKIKKVRTEN